MTKVEISEIVEMSEVFCQYDSQNDRQPVYVYLDCRTGELSATYNAVIGGGCSFYVYHGHEKQWGIDMLTVQEINNLLVEIEPLAQRIVDGYERDGDKALFSGDAEIAMERITSICDDYSVNGNKMAIYEAGDWYDGIGNLDQQAGELNITADTTDEDLATLESSEQGDGQLSDQPHLVGLDTYLEELRDYMREQA